MTKVMRGGSELNYAENVAWNNKGAGDPKSQQFCGRHLWVILNFSADRVLKGK